MSSRRSFFQDAALLGALSALIEKEGEAQVKDEKVSNYWDAYFAQAEGGSEATKSRGGPSPLIDPARQVQLIHGTANGLRYTDTIPDSELCGDADDVVVTFNPGHFRPASDDYNAIKRSKGSQVRVDWFQKQPIWNFLAPMAWAGLAAWSVERQTEVKSGADPKRMDVKAGPPIPTLEQLDFRDPNAPNAPIRNEMPFMGGSGRLALTVRSVRFNQRIHTVLDKTVRYSSIVSPFFGFAPLAIPALRAFTDLLGAIFSHEAVIMNSLPIDVLATQHARKNPHDVEHVKIVDGDFIAVPFKQTPGLKDEFEKLRIDKGWLVHQDADKSLPVELRARDKRIPDVTYVSLNLNIKPLTDVIGARKG